MGVIFIGVVVTTLDSYSKAKLAQPGNREWATVIQGVNSDGWAIPLFIVLAVQYHLINWREVCDLLRHWPIKTTDNGWTTNEAGLEWIKHFEFASSFGRLFCQRVSLRYVTKFWPLALIGRSRSRQHGLSSLSSSIGL